MTKLELRRKQLVERKQTALDAFMIRKDEIDTMLERIQALSDEHFNVSPDAIHWGHVGSLAYYAELLKQITDSAFNEGECAT